MYTLRLVSAHTKDKSVEWTGTDHIFVWPCRLLKFTHTFRWPFRLCNNVHGEKQHFRNKNKTKEWNANDIDEQNCLIEREIEKRQTHEAKNKIQRTDKYVFRWNATGGMWMRQCACVCRWQIKQCYDCGSFHLFSSLNFRLSKATKINRRFCFSIPRIFRTQQIVERWEKYLRRVVQ